MAFLLDDQATRPMLQPWNVSVNDATGAVPFTISNAATGAGIGAYASFLNNSTQHMQVGINSTAHTDPNTGFIWMFQANSFKNGTAGTERFRITGSGVFNFNNTSTGTTATAGAASALPATPAGYWIVTMNGAPAKIPYYA